MSSAITNERGVEVFRFNALTGLSCYVSLCIWSILLKCFNALTGLSCYDSQRVRLQDCDSFNALTGLSCYGIQAVKRWHGPVVSMPSRAWVVTPWRILTRLIVSLFQCPHGLELLQPLSLSPLHHISCFNALTGLSCYSKNVQYFKFFMILFMHTCYL